MLYRFQARCSECQGEGEVINEKDKCDGCQGRKVLSVKKVLEVHVDKGMKEMQKIYFRGEGDQQVRIIDYSSSYHQAGLLP